MKIINLEQGSQEWHLWRKKLLTATDASVIMNASPYVTLYQLWQRKLSLLEEQKSNPAMERGSREEPILRSNFNEEYGLDMQPTCIESEKYNFIGASLDGLSKCKKYILEVKSNGLSTHTNVKSVGPPTNHFMQMQHQFLASDNTVIQGFYKSHCNGDKIILAIDPNNEWQEMYIEYARAFWDKVLNFEAPALSSHDYKDMNTSSEWELKSEQYSSLSKAIKLLEIEKENLKKDLIALAEDQNCIGHGIKLLKKIIKGRIDYDSVVKEFNIDVENYRKESSSSWTIMIDRI